MQTKIQLRHPTGKKAVSMDKTKYDLLKDALLKHLRAKGESTHEEILKTVEEDFRKTKTNFEGSIEWHLEWVKLDLEARKEINRTGLTSPVKFAIVKQGN